MLLDEGSIVWTTTVSLIPILKAAQYCRTPKRGRHSQFSVGACVLECGVCAAFWPAIVSIPPPGRRIVMPDKTRVLILGGGFGGLYAALQFEKLRDPRFEVTVVNRENFFLFTPMLHEIAASDLDLTNIVNPVRKMIRHVNFFCGDVEDIDVERSRSSVSHGFDRHSHTIEYDHLVLGSAR